jgi:TorA maturation chaperone TorD
MLSNNNTELTSNLLKLAKLRSKVYKLLSTIYIKPPNIIFLKSLKNIIFSSNILESFSMFSKQIASGLLLVRDSVEFLDEKSIKDLKEELAIEFTRLFRGLKPDSSPPPPYESVYIEGYCFGKCTFNVLKEYALFGLATKDKYRNEPPDHISFELEFMHLLCSVEADKWSKRDIKGAKEILSTEKNFLEKHIIRWIDSFCEGIRKYDRTRFYKGWANVTEGWINFDYRQISEHLELLSK